MSNTPSNGFIEGVASDDVVGYEAYFTTVAGVYITTLRYSKLTLYYFAEGFVCACVFFFFSYVLWCCIFCSWDNFNIVSFIYTR